MVGITVLTLGGEKTEPTYLYEDPAHNDSKIILRGFFIEQHGRRMHSFFSPCRDLDRLCITPQIGDKSNQEMAELFSARSISWQRRLTTSRVQELKDWWERSTSLSTNGSIVWLPGGYRPVTVPDAKTSYIDIDPSAWTVSICPDCEWTPAQIDPDYTDWQFDCCPECPFNARPGKLVDGQHRVRGMSQAANPHNLEPIICTVLCEDENFTSQLTAKIFTEITSKAVGLKPLHSEFLSAKYDIKPKYSTGTAAGRNRKKAYEVVVGLNKSGTRWASVVRSEYKGRVKMINPTGSRNDVIEADRLAMDNIYSWIRTNVKTKGGEIKPLEGDSVTTIVEYLEYFLDAVLDVWGPGAHGTNDFWDESRGSKKAGQRKGVFRMMMHLFGIITARVKLRARSNIPTKDIYKRELEHIQNIEWTNLNTWAGVYTKQDTEQGVVRKVLSHIYLHAPSPLGGTPKIPPRINSWMNAQPDTFRLTFDGSSIAGRELKIKSRSESKISDPLHRTPVSTGAGPINASTGCTITIKHGGTTIYEEPKGSHNHIVNYTDLEKIPIGGGAPVAVVAGDNLDVTVSYKNGWSNTPRVETRTITITA